MTCPRCSVAEISPATGQCELCGYVSGGVAVESHQGGDTTTELARRELAHQFRFDVLLGEGARSVVYLARDLDSDHGVVIKVIQRTHDKAADERFQRNIAALAQLNHPNVVPVRRYGITDSLLWYSMDHVRGRPLRSLLRTGEQMPLRTCLRLANQLASALDYIHRRGLVHGNLKPENVLVDADSWIHVCDATVAASLEVGPPSRATGPLLRPPAYLAPEDWFEGERSAFSDQYALAVLLHECLTHAVPFGAGAPRAEPQPLTQWRQDLPMYTQQALHRALSTRPGDRFSSVLDFVAGLEVHAGMMGNSRPSGRMQSEILLVPGPDPTRRSWRWLLYAAGVAAVVAAAVTWQVLAQRRHRWAEGYAVAPPAESRATAADSAPGATDEDAPAAPRVDPPVRGDAGRREPRAPRTDPGTPQATPPRTQPRPSASVAPAPAPAAQAALAGEPGLLFVSSTPWGQIFIDGQMMGTTPRANLPLSPGTHVVRLLRDGFEPFERTITIASGETLRLTGIVLTERQP